MYKSSPPPITSWKAQAKAPYSASIFTPPPFFLGCYNCRFDEMKNVSLLPSEGKERVPIMFKFCLHFDGNEFFFSFFEVWLLQSACDCKYGLSSEGQNDVGVWSQIGNVTLCSVYQMNSYRAPARRHGRSASRGGA